MSQCPNCHTSLPDNAKFCASCGTALTDQPADTSADDLASMHTVSGLETVAPGIPTEDPDPKMDPRAITPGTMIASKYKVERNIGAGGMGVVYKAVEDVTDSAVAIKLIPPGQVRSEKAVQRLIDEGKTTRGIAHPNVVRIFDIGVWNSAPYIAMEYVEGKPLHVWRNEKMTRNEEVSARTAGQIIKEVLNGLEAAHAEGVIHRDLKPENIMLIGEPTDQHAKVKIVDFGIALATNQQTQEASGTGLGTQLYMAPEQIRNANAANPAADLYSVSKIFYELIVGVLPTGHWSPPSDGRSDVPQQIDELIRKGLSPNRDSRPQSAADYREQMIAGFNPSQSTRGHRLKADPTEMKDAQKNLMEAYGRMFKAIPKWGWAVIIIFGLIAAFAVSEPQECFYDNYNNWVCS
ncbi:serine/threonine-protein kinase [Henriciella sp. AS95]|uniref:serine/threonine-protein kinase n=1 Tax=Henriciella sp. AS95 TaxID=3135782 RepID=UPI0031768D92